MTHFALLHKRKYFCFIILFITFSIFTADIFDLREELQILSYSYNSLDDNITTGMTDHFALRSGADPHALPRSPDIVGRRLILTPASLRLQGASHLQS